jgi:hemolysin activation/secretion protein
VLSAHAQQPDVKSDRNRVAGCGGAEGKASARTSGLKPLVGAGPAATGARWPSPAQIAEATIPSQLEVAPSPAALKFDIARYVVEGNTLLKPTAISKVLAPYTGKLKDFADLQQAL